MNKFEIAMVAVLVAALLGWGFLNRQQFSAQPPKPGQSLSATGTNASSTGATHVAAAAAPVALPAETRLAAATEPVAPAAETPVAAHALPEKTVVLSNRSVAVTISSWGGAVTAVDLKEYRHQLDPKSGPVHLDFSAWPALAMTGVPALSTTADYEVAFATANQVVLTCTAGGLTLQRTIAMEDDYRLAVTDVLSNASSEPLTLPPHSVACGPMSMLERGPNAKDFSYLGMDSLPAHGGEGVKYWMKGSGGTSCSMSKSPVLALFTAQPGTSEPPSVVYADANPASWVATKNKFFVQVLSPEESSQAVCELRAWRDLTAKGLVVSAVAASAAYPARTLQPGESYVRPFEYYVGPKKYTLLKALGNHQDDVMEFGTWFGWMCKILLPTLNWIYWVIPNYGLAIILLTLIVRIVFWPLTHKSTESMKKMQAIQPLVTQIREKYKDKPQKMNQEVMALYREHKVNPMSGCLPMVIQIPVFIALFTVLRSAVELRYASFLWIHDLSEPERLFAGQGIFGMLPVLDSLNILPLLMTATTIWQQKLTPSAGDPQQQKIMNLMPIFMLFMFYNMASGLVLYWTVSQVLAIVQMLLQRRKAAAKAAAAAAA